MDALAANGPVDQGSAAADQIIRWAPRAAVVALAINVFLVIVVGIARLAGAGDWRVVTTALLFTALTVLISANVVAIERRRGGYVPYAAGIIACMSFGVLVAGMLVDGAVLDAGAVPKAVGVGCTLAIVGTYASVLSLPRLPDSWLFGRALGYFCAAAAAFMIVVAIVAGGTGGLEFYLITGVLVTTASIVVVLGGRVASRAENEALLIDLTTPAPNVELYGRVSHCPVCGAALAAEPVFGASHECRRCGTGFRIEITQRRTVF